MFLMEMLYNDNGLYSSSIPFNFRMSKALYLMYETSLLLSKYQRTRTNIETTSVKCDLLLSSLVHQSVT